MPGSDLSELLDIEATSDARSLNQIATAAVRSVPGCAAANVVMWTGREPVLGASTHPDLPRPVNVQPESGRGPVPVAPAQVAEPVSRPDTLAGSAEEALAHMRQISQRLNVRAIEVARQIVDAGSRQQDEAPVRPKAGAKSRS